MISQTSHQSASAERATHHPDSFAHNWNYFYSFSSSFIMIYLEAGIISFYWIIEELWFPSWRLHELHSSCHYATWYIVLQCYCHWMSFKSSFLLLNYYSFISSVLLLYYYILTSMCFEIMFLIPQSLGFPMKPQPIALIIFFRIMVNWLLS